MLKIIKILKSMTKFGKTNDKVNINGIVGAIKLINQKNPINRKN